MGPSLKAKIITSFQELETCKIDWEQILTVSQNDNPFIEFEWIALWWELLSDSYQIFVIKVEHEGNTIGFLPIMKKEGRFVQQFFFIGYGQSNYMDVIATERWKEAVIRNGVNMVLDHCPQAIFNFHGLMEGKGTAEVFRKVLKEKEMKFYTSSVVAPFVNLANVEHPQYCKKRLKKHGVDRKEKRLKVLGNVRYSRLSENELSAMFSIHAKRWKDKNDTSGFTKGATRQFFEQLARIQDGALKTSILGLFVEEKLVAFVYGVQCRARHVFYLPGHDDDFGMFSPGKIIFKESILSCLNENIPIFDMSIGYEPYKYDWNTEEEQITKLLFPGLSLRGRCAFIFFKKKEELIQQIKKHRSLVLFKRNTLGRWGGIFKKGGMQKILQGLMHICRFIFHYNQCLLYRKSLEEIPNIQLQTGYKPIYLKDLLAHEDIVDRDLKEVIKRLYKKEEGFFKIPEGEIENWFWVNDQEIVFRKVGLKEELPKGSLYISDFVQYEPDVEIAILADGNTKGKQIYLSTRKQNPRLLAEGFVLIKTYKVLTVLGRRFIKIKRNIEGGDDSTHDYHQETNMGS